MPRIKKDDLEYCVRNKRCIDCHAQNEVIEASEFQRRRRLVVPCCRKHFNEYKSKMSQPNHRKYQRRSENKQKLGVCSYPGCHNKLIPQELIPRQLRDRSCGLHGTIRAFRLNRTAISDFILDYCPVSYTHLSSACRVAPKRGTEYALRYEAPSMSRT